LAGFKEWRIRGGAAHHVAEGADTEVVTIVLTNVDERDCLNRPLQGVVKRKRGGKLEKCSKIRAHTNQSISAGNLSDAFKNRAFNFFSPRKNVFEVGGGIFETVVAGPNRRCASFVCSTKLV
jgi:hypothetical protein